MKEVHIAMKSGEVIEISNLKEIVEISTDTRIKADNLDKFYLAGHPLCFIGESRTVHVRPTDVEYIIFDS